MNINEMARKAAEELLDNDCPAITIPEYANIIARHSESLAQQIAIARRAVKLLDSINQRGYNYVNESDLIQQTRKLLIEADAAGMLKDEPQGQYAKDFVDGTLDRREDNA